MGKNRRPAPTWKDWLTGSVPVPRWWIVTTGAFILSTFGWLPPSARGAADLVFWSVNVAVFVWWIQKRGGAGDKRRRQIKDTLRASREMAESQDKLDAAVESYGDAVDRVLHRLTICSAHQVPVEGCPRCGRPSDGETVDREGN